MTKAMQAGIITSQEIDGQWYYVLTDADSNEIIEKVRMSDKDEVCKHAEAWDIAALFGDFDWCEHDGDYIHVGHEAALDRTCSGGERV